MKTDLKQIEQDVLVALSDFEPHNQNQIADLIGRSHQKSTNRVHVSRSLDNLKPYLKRHPNEIDELGKKWAINQDIDTIEQIVENYPSILPDFQKFDTILEMLTEKQFWLIDYKTELEKEKAEHEAELKASFFDCDSCLQHSQSPLCGEDEQFRQKCIKFSKELSKNKPLILTDGELKLEASMKYLKEQIKNDEEATQKILEAEFKIRLRLSPNFFERCLTNEPEELKKIFRSSYNLTMDAHLKEHPYDIFFFGESPVNKTRAFFDKIFEICVLNDVMKKEASEEAVKKLSEWNRYRAKVLEDIKRRDIFTYHNIPGVLKYKYKQEWENRHPKLESVKINFKAIEQNQKLKNMSGLNNFLNENQFSEEETALSQLLVGGLLKRREDMSLKDIVSELTERGATYSNTFVLNTLEKLTKTKMQDGVAHPVIGTVDRISWWSCVI